MRMSAGRKCANMFSTTDRRLRVSSTISVAYAACTSLQRTSARRRQISKILEACAGAVSSWLRREKATHLAPPPLHRRIMKSTGALGLPRKWEYCRLLPVLAGAHTRRTPAQVPWTSRTVTSLQNKDTGAIYANNNGDMRIMLLTTPILEMTFACETGCLVQVDSANCKFPR